MTKAGTGGPQGGGGGGGGGSDRKSSDKQPSAKAGRKSSSGGGNKSSKQKGGNVSLHAVTSSGGHHKGSSSSGGGGGLSGGKSGLAATTSNNNNSGQSRSYPRGVGLDFRKLAGLTLVSYIDHHGVTVRPEAPPSELAVAVARHFEQMDVDEEDCVGGFLERLEAGPSVNTDYARKTQYYPSGYDNIPGTKRGGSAMIGKGGTKKLIKKGKDGKPIVTTTTTTSPPNTIQTHPHRKRTKWAARPGEQVAAKVTRTDENGSWILASVQRFYPDTETYDVQDEDDTSKLIRLPWSHVMRLSTGAEGCFSKGSPECMAIFPETTSFYKAKVAKAPVWKLDHGVPTVKEIIVKFDDDEDGTGKTPHRRVPSRYVIPIPSTYFYDEQNDVDLTPPNSAGAVVSTGSGGNANGGSGSGNGGSGIISHGGHGSPSGPPSTSLVPSHTIGPMGPSSSSSSSSLLLSSSSSQAVAATAGK